ncbi:hypothetical protein [Chondromyces apiculatus]|uniref:Lipoprotein n=1 Tax=Chondromyces apiculatus DSM 436 TaxID=1192034 RepID=A0A017T6X9_9BACT|nr:hypothetical protein [Chondromyces apiculatus]EYF04979.1 Hypothetical protein CAP_3790 [Chondromyces apiculatus DSM 436]
MNVFRGALVATLVLGLVACGNKDDDAGTVPLPPTTPVSPTPEPAPTPTPTPTTSMQIEGANPKVEARVKAELDGRADGITGSALAVTGATASLQTPANWTVTKGAVNVVSTADKKAQFAATATGTEGASAKLSTATEALGFASCEWGSTESLTLGKSKLSATAADGVCTRSGVQVRTAWVTAEGLLVVGGWEPSGDSAGVFGAMRSIAKAGGGTGGGDGISACCAALQQNSASAPPEQKGFYISAAAACNSLRSNPDARAALNQVRALLASANVPASCR